MSNRNMFPEAKLRIAVAQARAIAGDVSANVATVAGLIEDAARQSAQLVVFPEKFLSGYEPDLVSADPDRYAFSPDDARLAPISEACRRHGVAAVVGAASTESGALHISVLVFNRQGEPLAGYSKRALFESERAIYSAGTSDRIVELCGWRFGLGICYDAGFPEHARALAQAGSHVYLVSSLFSVGGGYHESRVWFPARALDNTIYAVMSNHIGITGGWNACGSSAVWDPMGDLVAEAASDSQGLVVVDLDPSRIEEARAREPMLDDVTSVSFGGDAASVVSL